VFKFLVAVFVLLPLQCAAAKAPSRICVDKVKALCGARTVTTCFVYSSSWQSVDERCLQDVELMIELEKTGPRRPAR
jgi:hypothetical protein